MTPHESHIIGRVGGESRCVTCYAAPDWALIEEPCDLTVLSETGRRKRKAALRRERDAEQALQRGSERPDVGRPHMTLAEMRRVHAMREAGTPWSRVAAAVDRSESSLQRAYTMWLRGEGRLAQRERRSA